MDMKKKSSSWDVFDVMFVSGGYGFMKTCLVPNPEVENLQGFNRGDKSSWHSSVNNPTSSQ